MSSSVGMAALFAGYPCSSFCTTIATSSSGISSRRATSIFTRGLISSRFGPLSRNTRGRKEIKSKDQRWQNQQLRCGLEVDSITPAAGDIQQSSTETAVAAALPQVEKYEVSYRHARKISDNADGGEEVEMVRGKGWTDSEGNLDERWVAKFRGLVVVASDRMEVHSVLATQRGNWNQLFHHTIVIASVSAATVAAINGAEPGAGLMLLAITLNLICATFMALVNFQQPSQLAEEQRRAARFLRRLVKDVESTLEIDPDMREEASIYWEDKLGTLYSLDRSFPLPLSPGGLEKFPRRVRPPLLSRELLQPTPSDDQKAQNKESHMADERQRYGWTPETEVYLRQTINRIQLEDVPTHIRIAEGAKLLNLFMARTSPMLAIAGAFCSFASSVPALSLFHVPCLAAALTVGAVFTHSVAHALQIGSGFEMFRNYAAYYEELQKGAERVLELPVNMREDLALFTERFNLELGHHPLRQTMKKDGHAGRLF